MGFGSSRLVGSVGFAAALIVPHLPNLENVSYQTRLTTPHF